MPRTYYDVLGVPEDADADAIRAAYRERAKATHPDRSDDPDASDRFRLVTEAREVLTDPDERRRYDRIGHDRYVGESSDGPGDATETGGPGRSATDDSSRRAYKRRQRARRRYAEAHREYQRRSRETAEGDGRKSEWWQRDARASESGPRGDGSAWRSSGATTAGTATTAHSASAPGTTAGADPNADATPGSGEPGGKGYRVTRSDPPGPRFTPAKVSLAAITFLLYPVFLVSSLLPVFPLFVNVVVGVCTLLLVAYLLSIPEAGVLVFGGWTLFAPALLLVTGVGLFTPIGLFAWTACWVPCTLAVANLVFLSA